MRLAALVESADHVCCRYRLRAFIPFFKSAGHSLELIPLPRSFWGRWRTARTLGRFDAVILQRKLLSRLELASVRRHARRLLFDFDDAVWLRDSYAAKGLDNSRRLGRFRATVRACDAVVAGNRFLADNAACFTNSTICNAIPTCVDVTRYPVAAHRHADGDSELVWVGSSSTLRGLEAVRPMLEALGRQVPGIRLKLVCDRLLQLDHLRVQLRPWSEATEAAEISSADIGISWVPDDRWSRGKCGLKVLQYMAAGLPVVANPVGVQAEMVRPGETGFLASTVDEWVEAIRTLAADPELRRRLGAAGRRLVEVQYSIEAGASLWLNLLGRLDECRVSA